MDSWVNATNRLTVQQRNIAQIVQRFKGLGSDGIADLLFANVGDKGPEDAAGAVRTSIRFANVVLRQYGFRIAASRGRGGTGYSIQMVDPTEVRPCRRKRL